MSDVVYAVHTRTCTYLLDQDGICRWVLSRNGARAEDRCVGAQFVATLDMAAPGGLAGELTIGGSALFVRTEDERFVLIRTKPIEQVEYRGDDAEGTSEAFLQPFSAFGAPVADGASALAPPMPPVVPPALEPLPDLPRPPPDRAAPPAGRRQRQRPRHDGSDPDLLPAHHRVEAVFSPAPAPLPPAPPAHRVILQDPVPHDTAQIETPAYNEAPAPDPRHLPGFAGSGRRPAPYPEIAPPAPPPRGSAPWRDAPEPSTETQPLPPLAAPPVGGFPWGRGPAWPDFATPPPPPAVFNPPAIPPARALEPSAPELSEDDFVEVEEDGQSYSMEVTLTMPLYRAGSPRRR